MNWGGKPFPQRKTQNWRMSSERKLWLLWILLKFKSYAAKRKTEGCTWLLLIKKLVRRCQLVFCRISHFIRSSRERQDCKIRHSHLVGWGLLERQQEGTLPRSENLTVCCAPPLRLYKQSWFMVAFVFLPSAPSLTYILLQLHENQAEISC